jgi:hypothetical protein
MNILDEIMGPLGREYCNYFYIMGLLSFGLLSYMIVNIVYHVVFTKKKGQTSINMLVIVAQVGITYLVNRLFYNMCMK